MLESWPPLSGPGRVIALIGAECTGKSSLSLQLAASLADATGLHCVAVPEYLREWCDLAGRTPRQEEQAGIAAEQARRIASATRTHEVVLADTTPLMTAVYHWQVFGDASLDAQALGWQRGCALTLLTALDLPWQADGLQRDGPHVRVPVDGRLRQLLMSDGQPFTVVAGQGPRRLDAALDACTRLWRRQALPRPGLFTRLSDRDAAQPPWPWTCEHCDEPACEHQLRRRRAANGRLLQGR